MLQITLTANAGILLQTEKASFLVDALHAEGDYPFSRVPEELLQFMNTGDNAFRNVDYLIFTHSHPDHYSPDVVLSYLQHNRVKRIILPEEEAPEDCIRERELLKWIDENKIPAWRLHQTRGTLHSYMLAEDVYLTAMCMPHISERFASLNCICLLISAGCRRILFTSDCDYQNEEPFKPFGKAELDAVFVNPLFFHEEAGRKILSSTVSTQHVFVYHVPFEHEDVLSMRALVRQDTRKYAADFSDVQILQESGQTIVLP